MSEATNEGEPWSAQEGELARTMDVPAPYVNRFYFTGLGPNVRLTFGEQQSGDGPVHMRAAVLLNVGEIINLRDLLIHMLKGVEVIDQPQSQENG